MRFAYPVLLRRAKEGGYVVTCRDLPALITQGNARRDALAQAADAVDEAQGITGKTGQFYNR